ncbi:(Fe-S)-binding protein [Nitrosovibrio tenuis]|uniref:Glycolate oxidase iron-sulfur subunit n=1 Tax=Nitrosovibrio tenuis TaxID=1233 RepID=A0A1H7LY05_9PROT|nr:(Fe-S)-binding protein [Nitrosovibrio tenuis]SEL03880.1 glycolate oxidase iron-sulfur subunit [Nitrosovibrio tenuis]
MKPVDFPSEFSGPLNLDSSDSVSAELSAEISAEANRCVACGLCLPHCPTYRITQSEADSPRGRIALMSGVTSGRIPINARFALHMDRCLTCRACEAVCPNNVRFGQLIDKTRAMLEPSRLETLNGKVRLKPWLRKLLEHELIAKPERIEALRPLLRFYQRTGLQKWMRKSGLLGKSKVALLDAQLPIIYKPCSLPGGTMPAQSWQERYPSTGEQRGEVGLFLGCVARLTDAATINAAIVVLNRLGYTVHVPREQTCCGALHQHGGELETAQKLARQNIRVFGELSFRGLNLQAIISTASGCGAQLAEYFSLPALAPSENRSAASRRAGDTHAGGLALSSQARNFSAKVMDINAFLAIAEGWHDIKLKPLPYKVAVHEPCSLRNVLRGAAHPYKLLTRIPEAQIVPLSGNNQCCGAAGTYFADQPEMAQVLLHDKVAALNASGARYLATSNVGCAMHMGSTLGEPGSKAGSQIEVVHPVTLLARQMG